MAATTLPQESPAYTFTIRQRAGLQVLDHAMQYVSGGYRDHDELTARLDAARLMWFARERILEAAAKRRMPNLRRLYREAMSIVWRNPQAGVQ